MKIYFGFFKYHNYRRRGRNTRFVNRFNLNKCKKH